MRHLLVPCVLLAFVAAGAEPAQACSCAAGDPRRMLAEADAAFIGVLVGKRLKSAPLRSSADTAIYTFRVTQRVKGRLGRTVEVESPSDEGSCGIAATRGRDAGILLYRTGKRWRSYLCSQLSPTELRRALRPLPRPNGWGDVAVVVGGSFAPARLLALDARGRTLGYGYGSGETDELALCANGRVAELAVGGTDGRDVRVVIRDLPTLRRRREVVVPRTVLDDQAYLPDKISCTGDDIFLAASGEERSQLFRIRGSRVTFARHAAAQIWLGGATAYLVRGTSLTSIDLTTGKRRELVRLPPNAYELAASPDGRRLAVFSYDAARVSIVDITARRVRTVRAGGATGGTLAWIDDRHLLFAARDSGRATIFDVDLRRVGGFTGWHASSGVIDRGTLFGVERNGHVIAAELPRGPVRGLAWLPGPHVRALLAVPG